MTTAMVLCSQHDGLVCAGLKAQLTFRDPCLASSRRIASSCHPCLRRRALTEPLDSARVSGLDANPLDKRAAITLPQRQKKLLLRVSQCATKAPYDEALLHLILGCENLTYGCERCPQSAKLPSVLVHMVMFWKIPGVRQSHALEGSGTPTVSQKMFRGQSPKITCVSSMEDGACTRCGLAAASCLKIDCSGTRHDPRMDFGACSGTFLLPTLFGGVFNAVCVFGALRTHRRLCHVQPSDDYSSNFTRCTSAHRHDRENVRHSFSIFIVHRDTE